jgi:hypothetical protein
VAQTVLLGAAVTSAIGVGGYRLGIHDGVLFFGWLAIGVIYHIIFGSGLVRRRERMHDEGLVASQLVGRAAGEAERPLP